MKSVTSDISARLMEEFPQYIFSDSHIAKQVQLQRINLGYVLNHGSPPCYKEKLATSIKYALHFATCFDASFTSVSNKKQVHVHVVSFSNKIKLFERNYIGSYFIGHGDAKSYLKRLLDVFNGLDYIKEMVQIWMDGPNVS